MDINKMYEEKARLELHKNTESCFEQILDAVPQKTAAVRPPVSHLTNRSSKTNKMCGTQLNKQGRIHKGLSQIDSYTWTCQCRVTSKNLLTSAL